MKNESHRRSVSLSNPVDPSVIRVLRLLDPIARAADCSYFVAGATARDLILVNVHGLRPGRATRDIDFGVAVQSWAQFELLKERLTASRQFTSAPRVQQRLIYTDQGAGFSVPVDLIPFRGIASADGSIAWPPSRDIVMNVSGFEEALLSSVPIEMEEGLIVRVASVPGLTLLKLAAWADRGLQNNKDAADLYRLLTTYADAGNTDRLYDDERELLETAGFDMELAGAELLGRDVASICETQVLNRIRSLMTSEHNRERLVSHMPGLPVSRRYAYRGSDGAGILSRAHATRLAAQSVCKPVSGSFMLEAVPQDYLKLLTQYDTPTICNVIELFEVRPRETGYMDGRIRACFPEMPPIVGYAATATMHTAFPRAEGAVYSSLDEQVSRFAELPGPPIVVFQDLDDPAVGATFGEIMCATYQAFGAAGLITSGAARDLDQVRRLGFAAFSNGVISSHACSHIVSIHTPVRVGGLAVHPGDLLHADANGVTNIPHDIATEVAHAAADYVAAEGIILEYLKGGACEPKRFGQVRMEAMRQISELGKRVRARRAGA